MKKHIYDIFANKWLKDCDSIWLYSDPHFGDLDSYKLRFPTTFQQGTESMHDSLVEQLDEMQIKNINSKCGKNSCLIILGDIGNIECIKKLKAKYKILIMGNHDKGASNYKHKWLRHEIFDNLDNLEYVYEERPECKYDDYISFFGSLMKKYGDYSDKLEHYSYIEDNHLFDEVYEGPLMVNDRLILSHEPITPLSSSMFNIHGHNHNVQYYGQDGKIYGIIELSRNHKNVIAEATKYQPINLLSFLQNGLLSDVENIHRQTIDFATSRSEKKIHNKKTC